MNTNYFKATMVLIGTILGAGIFAVPYAIEKAGILSILVYVPVLCFIQLVFHLIYAEIVLSTKSDHRMVGYAGIYFGKFFQRVAFFISIIGKHGALVAYIILGGIFLHQLLAPQWGGSLFFYTVVLFLVETVIIFFGLKFIAKVEIWLTILLFLAIGGLSWRGLGYWDIGNYSFLNWRNFLIPYGVVFFAIGGQAAIPEICRILKNEKQKIRGAIIWGTILPAVLAAVFAFLTIGITGSNTTPDVLTGLSKQLDGWMITAVLVFGLLAVVTSYIIISQSLREVYWWDEGTNKNLAWVLATVIPFGIYLLGMRNLTGAIGLTGAITGGLYGIILIVVYFKVKKNKKRRVVLKFNLSKGLAAFLSLAFILGAILEIVNFLK